MPKVVQRNYHRFETSKSEELIELAREALRIFPRFGTSRHYTSDIGVASGTFVFEAEFESLAEYEQVWAAWSEIEEAPAFMEKWNALSEHLKTEIWELHEIPE